MKMSKKRPQLVKKTHAKDTRGVCEEGGVEAGKYGGLLGRKSGSQRWRRLRALPATPLPMGKATD